MAQALCLLNQALILDENCRILPGSNSHTNQIRESISCTVNAEILVKFNCKLTPKNKPSVNSQTEQILILQFANVAYGDKRSVVHPCIFLL